MKIFFPLCFFLVLMLACNQLAWAVAPTDTELKRFVAAYRVNENIIIAIKVASKMKSELSNVAQSAFVKCVADQIKPESLLPYSISLARESFEDAAQLNSLRVFREKCRQTIG
jgi:hypothetical protein